MRSKYFKVVLKLLSTIYVRSQEETSSNDIQKNLYPNLREFPVRKEGHRAFLWILLSENVFFEVKTICNLIKCKKHYKNGYQ